MDVLPDSRRRHHGTPIGSVNRGTHFAVPVFCANCGVPYGEVPEENMTFAFVLCQPCFDRHGKVAGTLAVPDEVFWARVRDEQRAAYGRDLTAPEIAAQLQDDTSLIAKLVRDRAHLTPVSSS